MIWEIEGGRIGSLPLPSPLPEEPGLCCHFWFIDAHICKWAAVHGLFPGQLGGNRFFNQPRDSFTMRWQFGICWAWWAQNGLGSKRKQTTTAQGVCYVCVHATTYPRHTHTHDAQAWVFGSVWGARAGSLRLWSCQAIPAQECHAWAVRWPVDHPNCRETLRCQGYYGAFLLSHWLRDTEMCSNTCHLSRPPALPWEIRHPCILFGNCCLGKEWSPGVHLTVALISGIFCNWFSPNCRE